MKRRTKKNKKNRQQSKRNKVKGGQPPPKMVSVPSGRSMIVHNRNKALKTLTISHREYVTDVSTIDGSQLSHIEVNPALPLSFPWLAQIARQFETYKFLKLHYLYVPNVGSSTDGRIVIAPDYDAADVDPISVNILMNYEDCASSPLWNPLGCYCSRVNLNKRVAYYTRFQTLADNLDVKTYDTAKLFIHTTGASAKVVGGLFVDYTIVLRTPQIQEFESNDANLYSTTTMSYPNGDNWGDLLSHATNTDININDKAVKILTRLVNWTPSSHLTSSTAVMSKMNATQEWKTLVFAQEGYFNVTIYAASTGAMNPVEATLLAYDLVNTESTFASVVDVVRNNTNTELSWVLQVAALGVSQNRRTCLLLAFQCTDIDEISVTVNSTDIPYSTYIYTSKRKNGKGAYKEGETIVYDDEKAVKEKEKLKVPYEFQTSSEKKLTDSGLRRFSKEEIMQLMKEN
jgi:hypothetical protein